jgi:prolyl-tRNA synthetase
LPFRRQAALSSVAIPLRVCLLPPPCLTTKSRREIPSIYYLTNPKRNALYAYSDLTNDRVGTKSVLTSYRFSALYILYHTEGTISQALSVVIRATRLIGAVIMVHGDGLKLPPAMAPVQLIVIPVAHHKPGVLEKTAEITGRLQKACRIKIDDSDKSPGWKFSER